MVLKRLQYKTGALDKHIYAYQEGISTTECITDVLSYIDGKKAAIAFIDYEKAFELASPTVMLYSLVLFFFFFRPYSQTMLGSAARVFLLQASLSKASSSLKSKASMSLLTTSLHLILCLPTLLLPLTAISITSLTG